MKVEQVSDRVMYVDIVVNHITVRMVATYFPHAGYSIDDYNLCFDSLRKVVLDGLRINRKCFVGGDFNSILDFGWRGNRLRELVHETNLEVSNNPKNLDILQDWTFKGLLGHKRIIDYCLAPSEFYVESAQSIDGLNLGSDHRVVEACLNVSKGTRFQKTRPPKMNGWKPTMAQDGAPRKFQTSIGESFPSIGPCLENLEQILHATVVVPRNRVEVRDRRKPWENDELRDLIVK